MLIGEYTYTTAQSNVTIEIQSKTDGSDNAVVNATGGDLIITVYKYPLSSQTAYKADTVNQFASIFYAGDTGNSDTTTSATYETFNDADWAADATLIGKASFPTTANDLGIKVANLKPGKYMVVANGNFMGTYATSQTSCGYSIYDGTNRRGFARTIINSGNGYENISSLIGVFTYDSIGDRNFVIQGIRFSGGGTCDIYFGESNANFQISVIPLDQNLPLPVYPRQITSTSSGQMKIASALIEYSAGTPTVTRQDGNWISSLDDNGVGDVTINFTSGTFSTIPNCTCTNYQGTNRNCTARADTTAPTTSLIRFVQYQGDDANPSDSGIYVICIGQQ